MGGRAAEEIFLNTQTTGASDDIRRATELAQKMVTEFGMSSLGPVHFHQSDRLESHSEWGHQTLNLVDDAVQQILHDALGLAKKILQDHSTVVHLIAQQLVLKETLSADEFKFYFDSERTPRST